MTTRRSWPLVGWAAVALAAVSCSSTAANTSTSSDNSTGPVASATASTLDVEVDASTAPGLSDAALIAAAVAALAAAGEPASEDREPLLKRSDTTAEVSFPTRADLPPVIGGEPHVHLDPLTGEVLRISHTR